MERVSEVMETGTFFTALSTWKENAARAAEAKLNAKQSWAEAYLRSEGKNEAARTSEADLRSIDEQREAEAARIELKASEYLLEYHLSTVKG